MGSVSSANVDEAIRGEKNPRAVEKFTVSIETIFAKLSLKQKRIFSMMNKNTLWTKMIVVLKKACHGTTKRI